MDVDSEDCEGLDNDCPECGGEMVEGMCMECGYFDDEESPFL